MALDEAWKDTRIERIVESLTEQSRRGKIDWQVFQSSRGAPSVKPDGYSYSTDSATVVVGSTDGDGASPYYINILDSAGVIVEHLVVFPPLRTVRLPDGTYSRHERSPEERDFLRLVRELYELARRKALKTDDVLDSLVKELTFRPPSP